MATSVFYVGSEEQVRHHAEPLSTALRVEIVPPERVTEIARPGNLAIFYNEYHPPMRDACRQLVAAGVPTLYAIDGISEWRNLWEGGSNPGVMRPVLCHKAAVIGRSQARLLESWGNLGKCEVVGIPRLDRLLERKPRTRGPADDFVLLVMTAKNPGFTREQRDAVVTALRDVKQWLAENPSIGGVRVRPCWRLNGSMARRLDVKSQLRDTSGHELAATLEQVDAVLTTPSTSMLEGMLQGLPVALLDYTNSPHYVPGAWRITASSQLEPVLCELVQPPVEKLLYQDTALHDALECHTPATPRLVELVQEMQRIADGCRARGETPRFPARILPDPQHGHQLPEPRFELEKLHPRHADFGDLEGYELRSELAYRSAQLEQEMMRSRALARRLERRPWQRVLRALRRHSPGRRS